MSYRPLTEQQLACLKALSARDEASIGEIAQALEVSNDSAKNALMRLKMKGLANRDLRTRKWSAA